MPHQPRARASAPDSEMPQPMPRLIRAGTPRSLVYSFRFSSSTCISNSAASYRWECWSYSLVQLFELDISFFLSLCKATLMGESSLYLVNRLSQRSLSSFSPAAARSPQESCAWCVWHRLPTGILGNQPRPQLGVLLRSGHGGKSRPGGGFQSGCARADG